MRKHGALILIGIATYLGACTRPESSRGQREVSGTPPSHTMKSEEDVVAGILTVITHEAPAIVGAEVPNVQFRENDSERGTMCIRYVAPPGNYLDACLFLKNASDAFDLQAGLRRTREPAPCEGFGDRCAHPMPEMLLVQKGSVAFYLYLDGRGSNAEARDALARQIVDQLSS